jgi:putative ABC transport system ATP-binding protein
MSDSENDVVIETKSLKHTYKQGAIDVPALRGVDLKIEKGEFTALAGPSGSGKSTLLNMIGVLDTPTAGVIHIAGHHLGSMSRADAAKFRLHNIGFVFQAYNLLPVLSAYENAEYILLLQGVAKPEREKIVMPLLDRVGLGGMEHRRPHELSGGQQQRVAVVRAIAAKPAFVLADEPTANVDSQTAADLMALMLELNQEDGITFVMASHDEDVIDRSRRVIMLKDGVIDEDRDQSQAA